LLKENVYCLGNPLSPFRQEIIIFSDFPKRTVRRDELLFQSFGIFILDFKQISGRFLVGNPKAILPDSGGTRRRFPPESPVPTNRGRYAGQLTA